jgi:RNA polymerase primary sigma factor
MDNTAHPQDFEIAAAILSTQWPDYGKTTEDEPYHFETQSKRRRGRPRLHQNDRQVSASGVLAQPVQAPEPDLVDTDSTTDDGKNVADVATAESTKGSIWWYLREVSKHRLLTPREEIELGRAAQNGDRRARQKLVAGNLRLVISIAKRYLRQGMDLEDLVQEGNVGLMQAVRKYDPTRGNKFSTYATWWIRQAITRALSNKSRAIRIPVHINEYLYKMRRAAKPFYQKYGRFPSEQELSEATGIEVQEVERILKSSMATLSIDDFIGSEDEATIDKFLEDKTIAKPDELAEQEYLQSKITKLLNLLPDEEHEVIRHIYGLEGCLSRNTREVANLMHMDIAYVRRLELRAVRKLRKLTHNSRLTDYLADA